VYRYGFNGKENDNEVKGLGNQQDYGMRIYDPRLGKFLSVDPMTSKYAWYTPYSYAGNKPIKFVDIDGLEDGLDIRMRMMEDGYLKGTVTADELRQWQVSQGFGAAMGVGVLLSRGAILRYGPQIYSWATSAGIWMTNPVNQSVGVAIGGFALELINPDPNYQLNLPGPGDEVGKAIKLLFKSRVGKSVEAVIEKSATFANASEVKWFGKLLDEGKNVTLLAEREGQKTGDFLINGITTELKTISGVKNDAGKIAQAVSDRIKDASKQANGIIIDVSDQAGATLDVVKHGLKKYWGQGSKDVIRVVGKGFDETYKKSDFFPAKK
jgi:RHS repeat-associated protein